MLTKVNLESSVPVYEQIENAVQFGIASGRLKSGGVLPSVRAMTEALGVNPNTVAKAYRDLVVMGYIQTRRGEGCYVTEGSQTKCRVECRRRIIARLHEVVSEAKAAGMTEKEIGGVLQACLASECEPYGSVPATLLTVPKAKKR